MRTLRLDCRGEDVRAWETFLVGADPTCGLVINDLFDDRTKELTEAFQMSVGLTGNDVDGEVGPVTYSKASQLGFDLPPSSDMGVDGPNWPPRPSSARQMDLATHKVAFGNFAYEPAPTKSSPEAIRITDDWARTNVAHVLIPQLKGVRGAPADCNVFFHVKVAHRLEAAFRSIDDAGLLNRVVSFGGTWVTRYIRGSRRTLSNHAWGAAIDVNADLNPLGTRPVLKGHPGSTRELVDAFFQAGFFWGGWFDSRPDAMHFECFEV